MRSQHLLLIKHEAVFPLKTLNIKAINNCMHGNKMTGTSGDQRRKQQQCNFKVFNC